MLPIAAFLLFVLFWLAITTLLGFASGWYTLMRRYPDHSQVALLTLRSQSGSLGSVGLHNVLRFGVCASGLRIGIIRLFGPFCRDFLVPWQSITISRKEGVMSRTATLHFGTAHLSLPSQVANRLARAAGTHWPEAGPFPEEPDAAVRSQLLKQWLFATSLAAAFFVIVPRIVAPPGRRPPIAVAILLPAIVFGAAFLVQYLRRRGN
jgi:hypothetical protein